MGAGPGSEETEREGPGSAWAAGPGAGHGARGPTRVGSRTGSGTGVGRAQWGSVPVLLGWA